MSRNEIRALIAAAAAIGLSMTPADAARLVEPTGHAEMRQLVEAHPEIDRAIFPGLSAAPLLMGGKKAGLKIQDVYNTSLWTGTGAARTITTGIDSGEGSLVWIKSRNGDWNNTLFDTARGLNLLWSNTTNAQVPNVNIVTDFVSSGYGLGPNNYGNGSGYTYVGWQFRQADKFFKIVQYTGNGVAGRQVAHGLGIKPGLIFIKRLDAASDWQVYHQAQGATKYCVLNSSAAFASSVARWNNSEPTSSAFTVGTDATVNANGSAYVAYIWAHDPSAEGSIQCGLSYSELNINLGWRPQFVLLKPTGGSNWVLADTQRGIVNSGPDGVIMANTSAPEVNANYVDLTATGFNIRPTVWGSTEVAYMAIREAA